MGLNWKSLAIFLSKEILLENCVKTSKSLEKLVIFILYTEDHNDYCFIFATFILF